MIVLLLALLISLAYQSHAKIDMRKPVMFSISPKLWTLFGLKSDFIDDAVKSIKFPEIDKQKGITRLRIYDGKVEDFSVDEKSVSFQNMSDGIHLSIKNVQYRFTIKIKVRVGKGIFGKLLPLPSISGDMIGTSKNASVDIKLKWNDFKFIPVVKVDLKLHTELNGKLKKYKKLLVKLEKQMVDKVADRIQQKIVKWIEQKVNPSLQKVKARVTAKNATYTAKFKLVNNTQLIYLIPKNGSPTPLRYPMDMDRMMCVRATKIDQPDNNRSKRATETKQTKLDSGKTKSRSKLTISCVYSKRKCKGLQCTYCTDIDLRLESGNATRTIQNCSPNF